MAPHRLASRCALAWLGLGAAACSDDGKAGADDPSAGTDSTSTGADTGTDTDTGTALPCPGDGPAALVECVDRDAYVADLTFIAQPREPGSAHWQAVQDRCAERLTTLGYEVSLHSYGTGVNVIGRKLGTVTPEQEVLLGAHYDHLPGCDGADDNASGTAGVLEAARVLATRDYPRTLVVACWDEEEDGLVGSEAYAAATIDGGAGGQLLFNYDFEMIGFTDSAPGSQTVPAGFDLLFPEAVATLEGWDNRGEFLAIIADEWGAEHSGYVAAWADVLGLPALLLEVPNDLKNSPLLADLQRSDHASFWSRDIPAAMLTDTSEFRYPNYHCQSGEDAVELLDHDFARDVIAATVGAAAQSLGL